MSSPEVPTPTKEEVVAIAVAMLYEHNPEDVREAFTIEELERIVEISEPFRPFRVEYLYRAALGW